MSMIRKFTVKAHVRPGTTPPTEQVVERGFSFGQFDAAEEYAKRNLPGHKVIPGGTPYDGLGSLRFEAHSENSEYAAVIYVKEI